MGTILYFIETTLLWIVALVLITGLAWRLFFFVLASLRKRRFNRHGTLHHLVAPAGMLAPFHRAVLDKPAYAVLRYIFHAGLFIVPIWFSGHIYLWEESRFEWYWTPLPDVWADWMTLAVLAICGFFLIRRTIAAKRLNTRPSDIILIMITALPFLSGFLLTHGQLSHIPFFDNYLWYLHVFSAEIMLLMIVLLFCRAHLYKERCVGCAACVENCPTETLEFKDRGPNRFFRYSHFQCICCGKCVSVCPEQAAGLRHELHPKHLFQIASKVEIGKVELKACSQCGIRFAPNPQIDKLHHQLFQQEMEIETLDLCSRCKKLQSGRNE